VEFGFDPAETECLPKVLISLGAETETETEIRSISRIKRQLSSPGTTKEYPTLFLLKTKQGSAV